MKPDELKRLARNFSEAELATLSSYLTGLDKGPRERVLAAVANTPGKMKFLSSARVRDAVISSSDQALAVDMMLRDGPGGPEVILADFRAAYDGRVSPLLMWEKHPRGHRRPGACPAASAADAAPPAAAAAVAPEART